MRRLLAVWRAAFTGLPRGVWWLAGATLVNRAGTMVLPFLALWLVHEQGLAPSRAGVIVALYGVGGVGGSWLGGALSDRLGAERALVATLLAHAAGLLALAALEGTLAVAAGVLVLGVVGEAFRPAVMAATGHHAPPGGQARSFALLRLAANLGMAVGPAAGGWLALRDYRWLFVADAATCGLAAALLARAFGPGRRPAASRAAATGDARGADERRSAHAEASRAAPVSPWRDRPFLACVALSTVFATVFFQLLSTVPLTFRDHYGLREDAIGGLIAVNALLIVAFEMVLVRQVERFDRMRVVALGALLVCLGFGALPWGSGPLYGVACVVVWSAGEMLSLPLLNAVVAERADARARGRAMGVYLMAFSLAFVLAPLVGTAVYDRFGPRALWSAVALAGPLLALAFSRLGRSFPGTAGDEGGPARRMRPPA